MDATTDTGPLASLRTELERASGPDDLQEVAEAARALLDALDAALALEPCHVIGMHDPTHTPRGVCDLQRSDVAKRVLAALGLDVEALPRRLHPPECGWCHDVTTQEEYRERRRDLYRWAGVEVPAEMAEPAPDASRPDDPFWALCILTDLVARPGTPDRVLQATIVGAADKAHPTLGRGYRVARALQALETEGLVQSHDGSTRGWSLVG